MKIYATAERGVARASGPSLIVGADPVTALPHHPTGKAWRYLATISDGDALIASRRDVIRMAVDDHGFFASRWALGIGSGPSHAPLQPRRRAASNSSATSYQRQRAEEAFHLPA